MREYSISHLVNGTAYTPFFVGVFEETEEPPMEYPHRHSFFSLVWFTAGSGSYVIDFQEYEIRPNRVFLVNPQQIHNWSYSDDAEGYFLMAEADAATDIRPDILVPYIDVPQLHSLLENTFSYLVKEFHHNDDLTHVLMKSGITFLYSVMYNEIKQQGIPIRSASPLMDKFHQLIATCHRFSTVEQFANELRSSPEELNRVCKTLKGISAKQFIINQKMVEAKRLLLYSTYNVSEIAYRLGYEDTSYFARCFRKRNQCSPSDFIEKYRKSR